MTIKDRIEQMRKDMEMEWDMDRRDFYLDPETKVANQVLNIIEKIFCDDKLPEHITAALNEGDGTYKP